MKTYLIDYRIILSFYHVLIHKSNKLSVVLICYIQVNCITYEKCNENNFYLKCLTVL